MNPKPQILQNGEYMITGEPGNSMLPILKSSQKVILKPVFDTWEDEVNPGDIVFCKVSGNFYTHLVKGKDQRRGLLIGNNHGHINGWSKAIYGKVIGILTKKPSDELKELVKEGDYDKIKQYIDTNVI